jgi:hypothetical protein
MAEITPKVNISAHNNKMSLALTLKDFEPYPFEIRLTEERVMLPVMK